LLFREQKILEQQHAGRGGMLYLYDVSEFRGLRICYFLVQFDAKF